MIRAKFKLQTVQSFADYKGRKYTFNAVSDDSTEENRKFTKYTPNGTLDIHVDNPAVFEKFQLGQFYYLDFTPVETGEGRD